MKINNEKFSMEGLKTQLMSLFMLRSSTTASNSDSSFYTMIHSILALTVIDNIMLSIPFITKFALSYMSKSVTEIKILHSIELTKKKTSSLVVDINLLRNEDFFGDAVLDYITNSCNVKSILFSNKKFLLNNKDSVLIDEANEIHFAMLSETKTSDLSNSTQSVEIYSYLLNMVELRKFVDKITVEYKYKLQNKLGGKIFYFDELNKETSRQNLTFSMKEFVTNRTFDNVVGKESHLIKKRVLFFKNNKKWYDKKGIPYTLGLLLSGPPGGGKTSTIKCVANTMQRHIVNVKLHKNVTKAHLEHLFFNDMIYVNRDGIPEKFQIPIDQRIYVFEDVDCQNSNLVLDRDLIEESKKLEKPLQNMSIRFPDSNQQLLTSYGNNYTTYTTAFDNPEKTAIKPIKTQIDKPADNPTVEDNHQSEKLALSDLLNIMDGILETPGRIIIMTSNFPEKLDSALIRPGRIDLKVKFPYCDVTMIIDLIEKFYDISLPCEDKCLINKCNHANQTPAEVSKVLFENFDDYRQAIQQLVHTST